MTRTRTRISPSASSAVRRVTPTRLDLARGESRVIVAMGPVATPPVTDLSSELVRMAWISGGNRLGIVRTAAGCEWSLDPNRLAQAVRDWSVDFPGTDHLPIQEKLALLHASLSTPSGLRVYIAGDYFITDIPHAVFDGVMVVQLWLYLTSWKRDVTPQWAQAPEIEPHLVTALMRYVATHPRALVGLTRATVRRPPSAPPLGELRPVDESPPVTGDPDESRWCTRSARLSADRLTEIGRWRDVYAPHCSGAVILMAVLTRAMRAAEIPLAPHIHVVVDGRRYDTRLRNYLGNAAVGINLPFSQPYSPDALQTELSAAIASGRPLAAMLASSFGQWMSLRRRRARASPAGPMTPDVGTVLSFSHLLGLDTMPDGHWIGGFDAHVFGALTEPVDERGIAILMPKMRDHYDLSASFNLRHHSTESVDTALRMATDDPVTLLESGHADHGEP